VIEPTDGIDVGDGDVVFEKLSIGGITIAKLAQDVVRFIE